MKWNFRSASIAAYFCLILPFEAYSYQCERPSRETKAEFEHATAVFVGKVLEIETPADKQDIPVVFELKKNFKGHPSEKIRVFFNTIDNVKTSCNQILVGQEYLVYASGNDQLSTRICTRGVLGRGCNRTVSLNSAEADLKILNLISRGIPKKPLQAE